MSRCKFASSQQVIHATTRRIADALNPVSSLQLLPFIPSHADFVNRFRSRANQRGKLASRPLSISFSGQPIPQPHFRETRRRWRGGICQFDCDGAALV